MTFSAKMPSRSGIFQLAVSQYRSYLYVIHHVSAFISYYVVTLDLFHLILLLCSRATNGGGGGGGGGDVALHFQMLCSDACAPPSRTVFRQNRCKG